MSKEKKMSQDISSLQFPEVVVVEASAGSGKTYALAKRYLSLLMDPDLSHGRTSLHNILAITFTNKATVEMKDRILDFLKKIAFDAFSTPQERDDILGGLKLDRNTASQRALAIMDEIVRHYNFFQVQTIDSFMNMLLLGSALSLGRSAHFSIKRDYARHLLYCFDLIVDEAAVDKDVECFFEEFLEHYLFVEARTGWFPKKDILDFIQSLFRLGNTYGHFFSLSQGTSADIIKQKKHVYGLVEKFSSQAPEGMNKSARKYIESFLGNSRAAFDIADFPSAFRSATVPMNKGAVASVVSRRTWERIRNAMRVLVELDSAVAYNPYVKLFSRLVGFLQRVSQQEDILFLEELNRQAQSLFDAEGVTVAEIYYRLAARFSHYLIDEFQDTSILQWNNLAPMVEDALASGGSLFYVGDRKQAIYRFRGGESRLFDEVSDRFIHFNVRHQTLSKNWRSERAIVEFNNQIFSRENVSAALEKSRISEEFARQPEHIKAILDSFSDVSQSWCSHKEGGYIHVEHIGEKNQAERDEIMHPKVIDLVSQLKNRFLPKDIAVLTRDNSEVERVTTWLLEAGISVESEKTLNILSCPLIRELISFLRFLYSPIDDLSFASFIMGDIFSSVSGVPQATIRKFIFSFHQQGKVNRGAALYRMFRREFDALWETYFDEPFRQVGFISVYELTVSMYRQFRVLGNFKGSQGFFMKFLELVYAKSSEYVGLGEFLLCLESVSPEEVYVHTAHSDSIRVLTIHKAKGLEFEAVVIPFLRMEISPVTGGRGNCLYRVEERDGAMRLARITKGHRLYSDELAHIYMDAYRKACIDELNTLYVALTRAKCELYVFVPQKSGPENNKARFFVPDTPKTFGKKAPKTLERPSLVFSRLAPSRYEDWNRSLAQEAQDAGDPFRRKRIRQGLIMHAILSRIGSCLGRDESALIEDALTFARYQFVLGADTDFFRQKTTALISEPVYRDIFYHDGQVWCEKEFVDSSGNAHRLDRLLIAPGAVTVVDYKFAEENEKKDHAQVSTYVRIVRDIYPHCIVKGVLLYPERTARIAVKAQ